VPPAVLAGPPALLVAPPALVPPTFAPGVDEAPLQLQSKANARTAKRPLIST
jgi:hypothetical protein